MVIEYIRYHIEDASRREPFEAAYGQAAGALTASPHCLGFELSRCEEDSAWYMLRIEWDSTDGHMQGFRRSAEFRSFFQSVSPFVSAIQEMRHYAVTRVTSAAVDAPGDRGRPA